jgi:hypothetical protein
MVLVPRTSPRVSFGQRSIEPVANENPGPGQYNSHTGPVGIFTRNGAAVFGTSPRSYRHRECPGPGAYNHKPQMELKGPAYSFSPRRKRDFSQDTVQDSQEHELGPGPGAYDDSSFELRSTISSGPSFSMASTFSNFREKVNRGPGPGHYTSAVTARRGQSSGRAFGFGTSRREPGTIFKTPGPGQYAMSSTMSGPFFSLTPRRLSTRDCGENGVPGPGAHDHHADFEDAPWASTM